MCVCVCLIKAFNSVASSEDQQFHHHEDIHQSRRESHVSLHMHAVLSKQRSEYKSHCPYMSHCTVLGLSRG